MTDGGQRPVGAAPALPRYAHRVHRVVHPRAQSRRISWGGPVTAHFLRGDRGRRVSTSSPTKSNNPLPPRLHSSRGIPRATPLRPATPISRWRNPWAAPLLTVVLAVVLGGLLIWRIRKHHEEAQHEESSR